MSFEKPFLEATFGMLKVAGGYQPVCQVSYLKLTGSKKVLKRSVKVYTSTSSSHTSNCLAVCLLAVLLVDVPAPRRCHHLPRD